MARHLLFLISLLFFSQMQLGTVVSKRMIARGDTYASFTSLAYYEGYYYCAYRNANLHYDTSGYDCGVIKIIRSKNGRKWKEYLVFAEEGMDLRDPQLTITPANELMLLVEKVRYKDGVAVFRGSCTAFINETGGAPSLYPISFAPDLRMNWLWNLTWIDGVAYGFTYCPCFCFVKSVDGKSFQVLEKFDLEGLPTEASIIKWKDNKFLAIVRRDRGTALMGIYDVPLNKWTWEDCYERIDCPHLIQIKGTFYLLGRSYGHSTNTTLYQLSVEPFSIKRIMDLGGESDCAYPGAVYRRGRLYVSYYLGNEKQGDIYLSVIRL